MSGRAFLWLTSMPGAEPPETRTRLLQTVLDRKAALVVGALTTAATAATAAALTGALWPCAWFVVEAALLGFRMTHLVRAETASTAGKERHVMALIGAGLAWSAAFGIGAALCMAAGPPVLAVMAGINVAGAAGAISSRNAAMPRYATLAMLLCCIPFGVAAALSHHQVMIIVALMVPLWVAGMIAITRQNYMVSLRMIRAELATLRLVRTDALTELPNRVHLEEELSRLCAGLERGGLPFAVLCLDLDGFKSVNDSHGHAAGDILLKAAGGRIANAVRDGDTVCRVGGDEFVVLLPGASPAEAAFVAARIITAIGRPFEIGVGETVSIGTSVGSASSGTEGARPSRLLAMGDRALYAAKSAGKGVHREHRDLVDGGR